MTTQEMLVSFLIESGTIDTPNAPLTVDILYWLNTAQEQYTKLRYKELEKSEKRIEDLRNLIVRGTIVPTIDSYRTNGWIATYPNTIIFLIEDSVVIRHTTSNTLSSQGITETTHDRVQDDIINPFSEHVYHNGWARPLKLIESEIGVSNVSLITDGTYTIEQYNYRGLKYPINITLTVNCELAGHTHAEIIKIAVKNYLENNSNPRLRTVAENLITT